MNVGLVFDNYIKFLIVKTDTQKHRAQFDWTEWSKDFQTQIPTVWLAMWLNDFDFDVIWRAFQPFLNLHSHITVLWRFCRISVISEFSFLGIGLKTKTWKSRKISIFGFTKFKCIWIYFLITLLTFWLIKLKTNKNVLNLINLDRLEAFKRQTPGTWLEIWVNHF